MSSHGFEAARTAVVLGAGFSYVAGLPLTRNLFSDSEIPGAPTVHHAEVFKRVKATFDVWQSNNGKGDAEVWLRHLYLTQDPLQEMREGLSWDDAISYALARLVKLHKRGPKAPYYHGITTSSDCPTHQEFWQRLLRTGSLFCVVSMNYDLLAEQGLRRTYTAERTAPLCYYGGFQYTQVVRTFTNLAKGEFKLSKLGNDVVLYKMHGSLNWAWEKHSPTMKIHDDVRAVFRQDKSIGSCAIIPPLPEKQMPEQFSHIWREAAQSLSECKIWIVCGYSLPDYDQALIQFFTRCASASEELTIRILSPASKDLVHRWQLIAPRAHVEPLPGLPEALSFL